MESLRTGVMLDGVDLHVTRVMRGNFGSLDAAQPLTWTLVDFEVADSDVDQLSRWLRDSLQDGAWYCDFRSDSEVFVVFSGQIFRYGRGEVAGREVAVSLGRSRGVPKSQLDWP